MNELNMTTDEMIMQQFKKHARSCSYHYADDSGGEWGLARQEKAKALELFDTYPHLHEIMREEMKKELWAGEFRLYEETQRMRQMGPQAYRAEAIQKLKQFVLNTKEVS